jgi:hypothetical protein
MYCPLCESLSQAQRQALADYALAVNRLTSHAGSSDAAYQQALRLADTCRIAMELADEELLNHRQSCGLGAAQSA